MNRRLEVPFSAVDCSGNELLYVQEVLQSGWLTTASKVQALENTVASITGAKHALALNSCTAALHLAIDALGIGEGDQVLVPSLTFTASAEVIRYAGAHPVVVDVDYNTRMVTAKIVEQAIDQNPGVKALIVVHFGGQAAPMLATQEPGIVDVCKRRGVRVIEDAAHAFPARCAGKMVGTLGDVGCFSFYANKTMTTGEGGMLLTNDDAIAERVRLMRLHGIDRGIWDRYRDKSIASWEYDVLAPGFKYNMPDLNAAVGLAQIERLESMRRKRQAIAGYYFDALGDIPALDLPDNKGAAEDHSWHIFSVVLKPDCGIHRDELMHILAQRGVSTSVHYKPLHRLTYYKEKYGLVSNHYPVAERIWQGTFSLPIYSLLKPEAVKYISDILHEVLMPVFDSA